MQWKKTTALSNIATGAESLRAVCINQAPYLEGPSRQIEENDRATRLQIRVRAAARMEISNNKILGAISSRNQ